MLKVMKNSFLIVYYLFQILKDYLKDAGLFYETLEGQCRMKVISLVWTFGARNTIVCYDLNLWGKFCPGFFTIPKYGLTALARERGTSANLTAGALQVASASSETCGRGSIKKTMRLTIT